MDLLKSVSTLISSVSANIYIGHCPDNITNCITLKQISGRPSQHVLGQQAAIYRQPSIQTIVRNSSYQTALGQCESIITILDGYVSTSLNIQLESDIMDMGKDIHNNTELNMIFRVLQLN